LLPHDNARLLSPKRVLEPLGSASDTHRLSKSQTQNSDDTDQRHIFLCRIVDLSTTIRGFPRRGIGRHQLQAASEQRERDLFSEQQRAPPKDYLDPLFFCGHLNERESSITTPSTRRILFHHQQRALVFSNDVDISSRSHQKVLEITVCVSAADRFELVADVDSISLVMSQRLNLAHVVNDVVRF
jgi:hypothetical protein